MFVSFDLIEQFKNINKVCGFVMSVLLIFFYNTILPLLVRVVLYR